MCRNIKILFNFDPPATESEIRAASTQFVGKVSGASKPSNVNHAAYEKAIDEITSAVTELLTALTTSAKPKNRQFEQVNSGFSGEEIELFVAAIKEIEPANR